MVVGNYGSGKTEVAVNLALQLAKSGKSVSIADLDIVNPYFRCREARQQMEDHGIRVVVPPAAYTWADLPIIVPEIKGMLQPGPDQISLFDVGGDDAGAKLLSSLFEALGDSPYELWQVINSRRPFTDTPAGCLQMRNQIEQASRLKVTGLAVNTHLMDETTPAVILEGVEVARQVSNEGGIPIRFVAAMEELAEAPELGQLDLTILQLGRYMLQPWIQKRENKRIPEAKAVPIGKP